MKKSTIHKIHPYQIEILFLLLLVITLCFLYFPSLSYGPVYDSVPHLTEERLYKKDYLSENFFLYQNRWLSHVTFSWIHQHVSKNIEAQRLFNIFSHVAVVILLFYFLSSLFTSFLSQVDKKQISFYALLGSALFALNPTAVYGTTLLVQRGILFITFFGLFMTFCFSKGLSHLKNNPEKFKKVYAYFSLSIFFYYLALASKEHAIALPAICFFLFIMHRPFSRQAYKHFIFPFLFFSFLAIWTILRMKGILGEIYEPHAEAHINSTDHFATSTTTYDPSKPMYLLSLINQGTLFFVYLFFWIIPYVQGMSLDLHYNFPNHLLTWPETIGFLCFIIWGVLGFYLLRKNSEKKLLGFGMLFPWILFATEFSVVRFHESFVLYRSYFWLSGFFVILPFVLKKVQRKYVLPVFVIVMALFIIGQQDRLRSFRSSIAVWQDAYNKLPKDHKDNPGSYRPYYSLAYNLIKSGKPKEALPYLHQVLKMMPKDYAPHYNLALAYDRLKNYPKAIYYNQKAIEINPDYFKAYNNLGGALLQINQIDEAIQILNQGIKVEPRFASFYNNLGVAYQKLNQNEKAAAYYHKAIELSPDFLPALKNYPNILRKLKRHDQIISFLVPYAKKYPHLEVVQKNLGHAYYSLGDYQKAAEHYANATLTKEKNDAAYYDWGNALMRSGKYQEAIHKYKLSLSINAKNEKTFYNLGMAYSQIHEWKKARESFVQSLKIKPDFLEAKEALGQLPQM